MLQQGNESVQSDDVESDDFESDDVESDEIFNNFKTKKCYANCFDMR